MQPWKKDASPGEKQLHVTVGPSADGPHGGRGRSDLPEQQQEDCGTRGFCAQPMGRHGLRRQTGTEGVRGWLARSETVAGGSLQTAGKRGRAETGQRRAEGRQQRGFRVLRLLGCGRCV